jgi:hypothetical protein
VNFNEFNVTVFDQISNSYHKLSESSTEAPVGTGDLPTTTEAHKEQVETEGEETTTGTEEDYEHDFDHDETPPPVATVRGLTKKYLFEIYFWFLVT